MNDARKSKLWIARAALLSVALLSSRSSRANDPATAQALFDQAQKLMIQKRWSEACPKLEESQKLDPGGGTLLHLALCREHEGKIATAWAHYQNALASAKRDGRKDRARSAQTRIDSLQPRLPRMRVRVAPQNRKLTGFRVTRDDVEVGEAQWGEAFPVDPGPRTLSARADGYKPWTSTVEIPASAGETVVEIPELEAEASSPSTPPAPNVVPPADTTPRKPRIDPEPETTGGTQRALGIVSGGIGVAGVAVGSVFGLLAFSKHDEADDNCRGTDKTLCNRAGVEAGQDEKTFGTVSTIAFVAGGVFLTAGVIIYLTAPSAKTRMGLAPTPHGLLLRGQF